jgi:hypothetical protein
MSPYWLVTLALAVEPEAAPVPLDVQLPAFLKALAFDRSRAERDGDVVVAVVFDPSHVGSPETKDQLLHIHKELTRLRVKGHEVRLMPVPFDAVSGLDASVHAVLVAPLSTSALETLARESARADLLTFAIDASNVDGGLVLGMEMQKGRPRFVLNRKAAAAAGASFESGFLSLCRIVER